MRYAHRVFDEIYYWSNNKYTNYICINELLAYIKYKLKDNGNIEYSFNKSNEQVLYDLKKLLNFLVDELEDFHINYFDGTNVLNFYKTKKFWKYITNKIDILDEITAKICTQQNRQPFR